MAQKNKGYKVPQSRSEIEKTAPVDGLPQQRVVLPLDKKNFIFMAIAGVMIVLGFLLMLGGSSTPEEFNPEIFSARRVVVAPTLAFLGFVFMAFAIIYRPRKNNDNE